MNDFSAEPQDEFNEVMHEDDDRTSSPDTAFQLRATIRQLRATIGNYGESELKLRNRSRLFVPAGEDGGKLLIKCFEKIKVRLFQEDAGGAFLGHQQQSRRHCNYALIGGLLGKTSSCNSTIHCHLCVPFCEGCHISLSCLAFFIKCSISLT